MLLRIFTATILIPVVVALVWFAPPLVLAGAAALAGGLALVEFFDLGERLGARPYRKWTLACSVLLFYAQYSLGRVETHSVGEGVSLIRNAAGGLLPLDAVLLIFLFGCVCLGLATRGSLQEVLPSVSVSAASLVFVVFPFSYLVRINEIPTVGRQLVLFTLCLIWAGDMLAYFVGKGLGRVPMAPALSPKKTWEGALGNLFASLLVGVLFARWMEIDIVNMMIVAGLGNVAGQMGDLIESAFKRGASVKDSGSIVPGHGGMYDRIDSLILAAPVVWAAYQWFLTPR
jgi:phosphatidate cytidylyltransferase